MVVKKGDPAEPDWPPQLAKFDPDEWPSEWAWQLARAKYARLLGFRPNPSVLDLVKQITEKPGGGRRS